MQRDPQKLVKVAGELTSVATEGIIAATQEVFDYDSSLYQSEINSNFYNASQHSREITEVTRTDRTVVYDGNVTSDFDDASILSDNTSVTVTRTATSTGQTSDSSVDSSVRNYDASTDHTTVVWTTIRTNIGQRNDYTFEEAVNSVPASYRHGGLNLSFKSNGDSYVPNSDNKYVQYRLMSDSFNTTPSNWQGVDDEPTAGSKNNVESGGVFNSVSNLIFDDCNLFEIIKSYIHQDEDEQPTVTQETGKFLNGTGEVKTTSDTTYELYTLSVNEKEIYYLKNIGTSPIINVCLSLRKGSNVIANYFVPKTTNNNVWLVIPKGVDTVLFERRNGSALSVTKYKVTGSIDRISSILAEEFKQTTAKSAVINTFTDYMLLQNGAEVAYNMPKCSSLIPYHPNNKYVYNGSLGSYSLNPVGYYNIFGELIGCESVASGTVTDLVITNVPQGTAALRFCGLSSFSVEVSSDAYNALEKIPQIEESIQSLEDTVDTGSFTTVEMTDITDDETKVQKHADSIFLRTGSTTSYNGFSYYELNVRPMEIYYLKNCVKYGSISAYLLVDSAGTVQEYYPDDTSISVEYYKVRLTIPDGISKLIVHEYTGVTTKDVNIYSVNEIKVLSANISFIGKKWVVFGDSLTERNQRTTKSYFDYVAETTGIEIYNMGRSGTGYKRTEDEGYAFYQRISNVPLDADVITIFGSGNDNPYWSNAMGVYTDRNTDTVAGCINTTLDNLWSVFPLAVVALVTPTPWVSSMPTDGNNVKMQEYANLIVQIAEYRGVPCLDLYHCSLLRPSDATFRQLAYSKDEGNGVHPDETGHKLIAPRFKWLLDSLLI